MSKKNEKSTPEVDPFNAVTVVNPTAPTQEQKIIDSAETGEIDLFAKGDEVTIIASAEDGDEIPQAVDSEIDLFEKFGGVEEETEGDVEAPEGDKPEISDDDPEELNLGHYIADQFKKDEWLPEDFEVTEETTMEDVYGALVDNMRGEAEEAIKAQVFNELSQEGYDQQTLQYAKLIASGVDINNLSQAHQYQRFSQIDLEEASTDELKKLNTQYYKDRNWTDDEIAEKLEDLEVDDKLADAAVKAKKHFETKHKEFVENQSQQAELQKAANKKAQEERLKTVNSLIDSGEVNGSKILNKKGFKKALFEKTHLVEVRGQEYPVSEFELFNLEMQNDPAASLWAFNQWLNKDSDGEELKKEVKAEAEKELFSGLKQQYEKSKGKTVTRKAKDQLDRLKKGNKKPTNKPRNKTEELLRNLKR